MRNDSKIQTDDDPFYHCIQIGIRMCTEGFTNSNQEKRWRRDYDLGLVFMLKGHRRWQVLEVSQSSSETIQNG